MKVDKILREYLIAYSLHVRGYISDSKFEELKFEVDARLVQERERPWWQRWFS